MEITIRDGEERKLSCFEKEKNGEGEGIASKRIARKIGQLV